MKRIYKHIYIISPGYYKTGGTELAHQLVHNINNLSIGYSTIVYIGKKEINPAFKIYVDNFELLDDIIDEESNLLIVPETLTFYLNNFKKLKKAIWWMSIDNYFKSTSILYYDRQRKLIENLKYTVKKIGNLMLPNKNLSIKKCRTLDINFVQSEYARTFLVSKKFTNTVYLTDYINEMFVNEYTKKNHKTKENIVLYNPAKGYKFTRKLMKKAKNIKFVPLVNLTSEEVKDRLLESKIYIDFGNHPGKDRFPREAAAMGCCILTNTLGSAGFKDVDIPNKFKFNMNKKSIKEIISTINYIFTNYEKVILEYLNYNNSILNEKSKFLHEIKLNFFDDFYNRVK